MADVLTTATMNVSRSRQIQAAAHRLIPGGAHTYAKGDDQFPQEAPVFIVRGSGAVVWDADGNEFIEYGSGLRSVTLGHGYGPVVEAAASAMRDGTNFVRPSVLEVQCAQRFLSLYPRMDMVKFAKHGSDCTTAAVKLARAYTGRDLVAVCADHPFFSTDDWFIATLPMNAGIPQPIRELTIRFRYNDLQSVTRMFEEHPGQIACLILEAENTVFPNPGFLSGLIEIAHANGALVILDEIITGFRIHLGGAQAFHDVTPDLCTFGKAMANGFAVSALAGRREIMELGGLSTERERVFLLSTTHGAETHGLAAAIATMDAYQREGVIQRIWSNGTRLADGISQVTGSLGLERHFVLFGRPCNLIFATLDASGERSQEFRTLFLQEMVSRGILCPNFFVGAAHTHDLIDRTIDAAADALRVYRNALSDGVQHFLRGRPVKPVARKFN